MLQPCKRLSLAQGPGQAPHQSLQITRMLLLLICPLLVIIRTFRLHNNHNKTKRLKFLKDDNCQIRFENNSGEPGHRVHHHTKRSSSLAAHCKVILNQQEQRSLITMTKLTNAVNQTTTEEIPKWNNKISHHDINFSSVAQQED